MDKQSKNLRLIDDLRAECQGYIMEIARKDTEIARLHAHFEEMKIQMASNQGVGALLRQAYNAVDGSIMNTINTRGAIKQKRTKKHPSMTSKIEDLESLMEEIRTYDVKEFFIYKPRPKGSHLKPHYRILAKTYRATRDTLMSGASKTRHMLRGVKK